MQQPDRPTNQRRPYTPPMLERVILDPIKEMLTACAGSGDPSAKNDTSCYIAITTNS